MARNSGSLLPLSRNHLPTNRGEDIGSLPALQRELNRLFDEFFVGFGFPLLGGGEVGMLTPRVDVSETGQDIQISAELPGLDEKEIEVTVAADRLTIHGEKKEENERKGLNFHLTERSYGTFSRTLRLPFNIETGQAKAVFKDGVLRITIEKPKEVRQQTHKIEVRREETGHGTASQPLVTRPRRASEQKTAETAAE